MDFSLLSKAFAGFVRTIYRYPLPSLCTFILLLIAYTTWVVTGTFAGNVDDFIKFKNTWYPNAVVENRHFRDGLPRSDRTCDVVNRIGPRLNADRATYWVFSNGEKTTNGAFKNFASIECPYVNDGVALIPEDMQKVTNAPSAEINLRLFPEDNTVACARWNIEDVKSSYLRGSMRRVGTTVVFECGIQDIEGHALGKLIVSWRVREDIPFDDKKVLELIETAATSIGVINSLNIPKDKLTEAVDKAKEGKIE